MTRTKREKEALFALYKAKIENPQAIYEEAVQEYKALRDRGADFLDPGDDAYPERLRKKLNTPPWLFYHGPRRRPLRLLQRPGVAIVGSRNASQLGLQCAEILARKLARRGVNVISGYARGVDRRAHYGALCGALQALRRGGGTTIVLSEGILHFAPRGELREINNWEQRTLILSQFPPTAPWRASQAMARNRLICALADLVIVIEAGPERDVQGKQSGTFHSGRTALDQGIPLFVVEYKTEQPLLLSSTENLIKIPEGNRVLLEQGGQPLKIDPQDLKRSLDQAFKKIWDALP